MALGRVTTWAAGNTLTAAALNQEFNNVLDNALNLISPLTGNLDFNGNRLDNLSKGSLTTPGLNFTGDQNTGLHSSAADVVEIAVGGVRGLQVTGTSTAAVNWLDIRNAITGEYSLIVAEGSDTNHGIRLVPAGTGFVWIATAGGIVGGQSVVPGLAMADGRAGLVQVSSGTVSLVAGLREAARALDVASATNYLVFAPAAAGATPYLGVAGGDSSINLELRALGTGGIIKAATAFVATAFMGGGSPVVNALYSQSSAKAWLHYDKAASTIRGSFNISSVTDTATGRFRVTWLRGFASANYVVFGTAVGYTSADYRTIVAHDSASVPNATFVDMTSADGGNVLRDATVFIVAFGVQ